MRMVSRRVIATVLTAAAAMFFATPVGAANDGVGAMKLEGAWIARVQLPPGAPPAPPAQWTYVLSPDSSGRSASFHGSIDMGLPSAFVSDRTTPLLGTVVMTGPHSAKFNSTWYGISNTTGLVYIGVNTGDIEFVGSGKIVGTHNLVFYLPSQDADGDGLPDAGQAPAVVYPVIHTIDTRLPLPQ